MYAHLSLQSMVPEKLGLGFKSIIKRKPYMHLFVSNGGRKLNAKELKRLNLHEPDPDWSDEFKAIFNEALLGRNNAVEMSTLR